METTKTVGWAAAHAASPPGAALLHLVAAVLRAASDAVDRLAVRLAATRSAVPTAQVVEFHPLHRDAGAPEGALYVDGRLVGVIRGVTRL